MEIKIVRMEPKPGAKIEKYEPEGRPATFRCEVICVLEDGRIFAHMISYRRKRDVVEELSKLPRAVDNMIWDSRSRTVATIYGRRK